MTHKSKHPPPTHTLKQKALRIFYGILRVLVLSFVIRLGIEFCASRGWLSKLGHAEEFVLAAVTNHVMFEVWEE